MQGKKIYIVGIGGIGLSSLAQLYLHEGARVSGSDRSDSPTTELLRSKGVEVFVGHHAEQVPTDADLLVYSDAVLEGSEGFVERVQAQDLGIPELSYAEALGKMTEGKKVIAIAGAHGKTTTTAMTIDVLEAAGLDPTGVVGSLRAKTKSNFRAGKGEYFVVEADEYLRHFLNYTPYILVITNIEADHLDYFKDLADVQSAFRELAQKIPADGFVVCDTSSHEVQPVIKDLECNLVDYRSHFDPDLALRVLPLHRINAAAVMAVAHIVGIDEMVARKALEDFVGTWRRFEYKGKTASGALVYDDYGHHPTEISTTLKSVREQFPDKRIIVAFHPHLYSRTKALMAEFAKAFVDADEILIAPIFAAREKPDPTVTSAILAERIKAEGKNAQAVDSLEAVEDYIKNKTQEGDVVVTMGAGDIYKAGERSLPAGRQGS
ncbi:MAG TPA: UDP-N-acetylmuramate--L-alanine ligase [Candidatus Paceibacterota bacterium]|nr:UDP-N-acetylmuramate--L-alanine ligase [Candidatus Paceibacterota bacterium]